MTHTTLTPRAAVAPSVLAETADRPLLNQAYAIGASLPGGRFELDHIRGANASVLLQAARSYALAYRPGGLAYMDEMHGRVCRGAFLTVAQAKGVLNCLMADAKKRLAAKVAAPAAQAAPALSLAHVVSGRYRVVLADGSSVSVRLAKADWATDKPEGTRVVSLLVGADDWLGQGFVDPDGTVRYWRKTGDLFKEALALLAQADDSLVYGLAYALHGSECFLCGRNLDTAESISAGYGPTCAAKNGLPWGAKVVPAAVRLAQAGLAPAAPADPAARVDQERLARRYDELFGTDEALYQMVVR